MSEAQITTLARWFEYQGFLPTLPDGDELTTDRDLVRYYGPDTEIRALYENKTWLVVLTIDSTIELVQSIYKPDLARGEVMELAYYESKK